MGNKIKHPFIPLYQKLAECCEVRKVNPITKQEDILKWDIYLDKIYAFLYYKFKFHERLYISYEYISAKTNISKDVVYKRVKALKDFGIVDYRSSKGAGGVQQSNTYTKVVDIVDSPHFKCVSNKYLKAYYKKKKDREERLDLLKGVIVESTWTKEQRVNYWRNINYEIITGEYLEGNKLEKVLYLDKECTILPKAEELKSYEIKELEND